MSVQGCAQSCAKVTGFATHGREDDDVALLERDGDGGRRDVHLVVPRLQKIRQCKCSFVRAPAHARRLAEALRNSYPQVGVVPWLTG